MMKFYCDFERTRPGQMTCRRCGRTVRTMADRVMAVCNSDAPLHDRKPEDFPCPHRGAFLEVMTCNLCGGEKGRPFDAFACGLHERCSIGRKHSEVRNCIACEERLATLESPRV